MENEALAITLSLIGAYLLGSIPSAYLIGRIRKGIDIRKVGSHNMGAMNTFYNVGFFSGLLVLVMDIGKGAAAVALARWLGVSFEMELVAGVFAVIGHNLPVWLKFHGGKGGAPLIGVFFFLMPWGIPIGFGFLGVFMALTRFPTLSYGLALLCYPFVAWLIYHNGSYVLFTCLTLLIPYLRYIPRVIEMRRKGGSWKHVVLRHNLKDRF